jgi:hypothetical protein
MCSRRLPKFLREELKTDSVVKEDAVVEVPIMQETRTCPVCTFENDIGALSCTMCSARMPKGNPTAAREREKLASAEAAARKRAREEADEELVAAPVTSMAEDGYKYFEPGAFSKDWPRLVGDAADAASRLLEAAANRVERITSVRRQMRFLPEGVVAADVPNAERYVALTHESRAIHQCARELKKKLVRELGPEVEAWVPQDLYVLHTPEHEEGKHARDPQAWHLDAMKKFAVAALVLKGGHPTEFPVGKYSDFSEGVHADTLDAWVQVYKQDGTQADEGRFAESQRELEHFTHHLTTAGLVTGPAARGDDSAIPHTLNWAKLQRAPAPKATPGFATCFWSNKVHRGPATKRGEERLVLFCTWLPPDMARADESETDYSYRACHLGPKLRLSDAAQAAINVASKMATKLAQLDEKTLAAMCKTFGLDAPADGAQMSQKLTEHLLAR